MPDAVPRATPGAVPGTLLDEADDVFAVLPGDLSVSAARTALAGASIGVVVGADISAEGRVMATVTMADLDRLEETGVPDLRTAAALLPAAILADADLTFAEYGGSPAVTLLDLGARAVVLLDGDRAVAVLPVAVVAAFFASESYMPPSNVMTPHGSSSDGSLGRPRTGLATVICAEPGCGHPNTLFSFNRRKRPVCTNPERPEHTLRIGG